MVRRLTLSIIFLIGLGVAIPEAPVISGLMGPVLGIEQAHAQKKRKTLFDVLFKRRKKKSKIKVVTPPRSVGNASTRKTKKKRSGSRTANRTTRPVKPAVIAVKSENAGKILVVGDFLAGGMARGLEKLYAADPNVVVVNRTAPASGLVRDDVVDWPNTIPELIEEFKPIAIVTLVGMNDRQEMRTQNGKVAKLSEAWLAEYNKRALTIASVGVGAKIPLVWVGLPPVRSGKMNADYLTFNEIYRSKMETVGGGEFVDVWDGFTNAEGKFVSAGPDINGQIVRLRGSKGINMTRAGKAKLAFFADKALKKIGVVGNPEGFEYASFGAVNPSINQPSIPQYDPATSGKTVVISLGSPASDGGDLLEGEKDFLKEKESEKSVSYNLVEKGESIAPREGRIDSTWGKPKLVEPEKEKADEKLDISQRLAPKPATDNASTVPTVEN